MAIATTCVAIKSTQSAAATLTGALTATSFLLVPRIPEFVAEAGGVRGGLMLFLYNLLPHFEIFDRMNWGLIIYDEVHLLPAPVLLKSYYQHD